MRGLIWKDLLVLRKSIRTYGLFLDLYLLLGIAGVMELTVTVSMITVIVTVLPLGAFSYDEAARWERYALCLPLSRSRVVGARYLFTLLIALAAGAAVLSLCVILSLSGRGSLAEVLAAACSSLGAGLFLLDILLPLNYKLGPQRARPYLYGVVLVPVLLLFGAGTLGLMEQLDLSWLNRLTQAQALGLVGLLPLLGLGGMGLSFLISVGILEKKEF